MLLAAAKVHPMILREFALITVAALVLCAWAGGALAQTASVPHPAAPAPATARPAAGTAQPQAQTAASSPTETQSFGDWTVRCFPVKAPAPCDMLQVAINKDTKQRVTSVSFAYVPSRDDYATQVVVPLGVSFAQGLTLAAGTRKIEGLKFRRCGPDGCYVEVELSKDRVEALAAGGNSGAISIVLYHGGKPINLPMSFNGYASGMSKLKELARQKAVTPPPATSATPAAAPATAPH
jgi:invasion protein IalB